MTKAIGISAPGWEHSTVRMHPTGTVTVITGSSPHGQGHATTWSQIVATELGVPYENVEVLHGDTGFQPYGLGTYGSRSLAVAGTALFKSVGKVRDKARQIAAHLLECSLDDLEWTGDRWQVKGSPDRGMSITECGGAAWVADNLPPGLEPGMEATTFFDPPNFTFPFGTHVCEVEVDPETGSVDIVQYTAVDDCGVVVNPMIVDGQVHGGVIQSIAQALFEETVYSEDGQIRTPTLVEYLIPSAADLPKIVSDRIVTPTPTNPLGAKGIGEAGTIAATPAVVNAVVDAVSGLGIHASGDAAAAGSSLAGHPGRQGRCGVIPVACEYVRPASLEEALAAVASGGKPMSGGQSLIPMMRLRLAVPETIVDLAGLGLDGISVEGDTIVIGAMTRHRDVAASRCRAGRLPGCRGGCCRRRLDPPVSETAARSAARWRTPIRTVISRPHCWRRADR